MKELEGKVAVITGAEEVPMPSTADERVVVENINTPGRTTRVNANM